MWGLDIDMGNDTSFQMHITRIVTVQTTDCMVPESFQKPEGKAPLENIHAQPLGLLLPAIFTQWCKSNSGS